MSQCRLDMYEIVYKLKSICMTLTELFVPSRVAGLFAGVELVTDRQKRTPATNLAALVVKR